MCSHPSGADAVRRRLFSQQQQFRLLDDARSQLQQRSWADPDLEDAKRDLLQATRVPSESQLAASAGSAAGGAGDRKAVVASSQAAAPAAAASASAADAPVPAAFVFVPGTPAAGASHTAPFDASASAAGRSRAASTASVASASAVPAAGASDELRSAQKQIAWLSKRQVELETANIRLAREAKRGGGGGLSAAAGGRPAPSDSAWRESKAKRAASGYAPFRFRFPAQSLELRSSIAAFRVLIRALLCSDDDLADYSSDAEEKIVSGSGSGRPREFARLRAELQRYTLLRCACTNVLTVLRLLSQVGEGESHADDAAAFTRRCSHSAAEGSGATRVLWLCAALTVMAVCLQSDSSPRAGSGAGDASVPAASPSSRASGGGGALAEVGEIRPHSLQQSGSSRWPGLLCAGAARDHAAEADAAVAGAATAGRQHCARRREPLPAAFLVLWTVLTRLLCLAAGAACARSERLSDELASQRYVCLHHSGWRPLH